MCVNYNITFRRCTFEILYGQSFIEDILMMYNLHLTFPTGPINM